MPTRLLLTLALLLALSLSRSTFAVDQPPPGTIPQEPRRQLTYCPIHAVEGFVSES